MVKKLEKILYIVVVILWGILIGCLTVGFMSKRIVGDCIESIEKYSEEETFPYDSIAVSRKCSGQEVVRVVYIPKVEEDE